MYDNTRKAVQSSSSFFKVNFENSHTNILPSSRCSPRNGGRPSVATRDAVRRPVAPVPGAQGPPPAAVTVPPPPSTPHTTRRRLTLTRSPCLRAPFCVPQATAPTPSTSGIVSFRTQAR